MAKAKTVVADLGWTILRLTRLENGQEKAMLVSPRMDAETSEGVFTSTPSDQIELTQESLLLLEKALTDWRDESPRKPVEVPF